MNQLYVLLSLFTLLFSLITNTTLAAPSPGDPQENEEKGKKWVRISSIDTKIKHYFDLTSVRKNKSGNLVALDKMVQGNFVVYSDGEYDCTYRKARVISEMRFYLDGKYFKGLGQGQGNQFHPSEWTSESAYYSMAEICEAAIKAP